MNPLAIGGFIALTIVSTIIVGALFAILDSCFRELARRRAVTPWQRGLQRLARAAGHSDGITDRTRQ